MLNLYEQSAVEKVHTGTTVTLYVYAMWCKDIDKLYL